MTVPSSPKDGGRQSETRREGKGGRRGVIHSYILLAHKRRRKGGDIPIAEERLSAGGRRGDAIRGPTYCTYGHMGIKREHVAAMRWHHQGMRGGEYQEVRNIVLFSFFLRPATNASEGDALLGRCLGGRRSGGIHRRSTL